MNTYNVRYFCTFSRKTYTYQVEADTPQKAVDECRKVNEQQAGVPIRIDNVQLVRTVTDWS